MKSFYTVHIIVFEPKLASLVVLQINVSRPIPTEQSKPLYSKSIWRERRLSTVNVRKLEVFSIVFALLRIEIAYFK